MKSMRYSLAAVAMVAVLAACSSTPASQPADAADADVTVTAANLEFQETTLTVASGEAFSLELINEDAAQHNVSIYTDSSASESLFVGEYVGEGTIVYDVPALEPGEYFFRCDLHPEMTGTLIVEG
jgi:plastocyanin